ncbi:hypothetical protein CONPUDRAFT_164624 [Coniophora puteana RWD-64-598 SS2]|uniref:Uncharacterized protein n=1 Tax=Coniophora puteana (strain RWD-64-598) TaxID=741705 RepID=A0A5M3MRW8_CONPW|nr:uncharacterized protein CONPUDRAFT_164624 [Coniophora puteana RWD-64-598 SS2]EIW81899.1 hypothetical protein CONPUDRAFT_164624 [Coniophora puteana RWD-64-598 SS2]
MECLSVECCSLSPSSPSVRIAAPLLGLLSSHLFLPLVLIFRLFVALVPLSVSFGCHPLRICSLRLYRGLRIMSRVFQSWTTEEQDDFLKVWWHKYTIAKRTSIAAECRFWWDVTTAWIRTWPDHYTLLSRSAVGSIWIPRFNHRRVCVLTYHLYDWFHAYERAVEEGLEAGTASPKSIPSTPSPFSTPSTSSMQFSPSSP